MKKSKVFLSVAFAMAIAAAVITKVHAQPQAFIKDVNDVCTTTERPEVCGPSFGQPCVIDGISFYQDSSCLNLLTFQ